MVDTPPSGQRKAQSQQQEIVPIVTSPESPGNAAAKSGDNKSQIKHNLQAEQKSGPQKDKKSKNDKEQQSSGEEKQNKRKKKVKTKDKDKDKLSKHNSQDTLTKKLSKITEDPKIMTDQI